MTATNEMNVEIAPASPNVRISPESDSSKRAERQKRRAVRKDAGRARRRERRTALPATRSSPSRSRMRIADTICMLSAKPITMTSGVMTLRNRLSLKPIQPSRPSDQSTASTGGSAATSISEKRRKKIAAIAAPNSRPRPL